MEQRVPLVKQPKRIDHYRAVLEQTQSMLQNAHYAFNIRTLPGEYFKQRE
jgi:hypothetical protein